MTLPMTLPVTLPWIYLFVPGNRPERFTKALAAGADAIILDLEDAVPPSDKPLARQAVRDWLDTVQPPPEGIVVRTNDTTSPWFADDLAMVAAGRIGAVMLPKAEQAAQIAMITNAVPKGVSVIPLIETARGLAAVDILAAADGVQRLAFGTLDYIAEMDLSGDERGLIAASARIALASRCADRAGPIAGVTPAIDDDDAIARDVRFARAFGFAAKLCIHPRQIAPTRAALTPRPEEIDWARRVTAAAQGGGVVQVDGRMVDRPVLLKAAAILSRVS